MNNVYFTLKERGFIENVTDEKSVIGMLESPRVCYTGFDPTGDSLHVGHLLPVMALMHLEKAGHRPIVLLGGGTAMIGDPSGKTEMRRMISKETIEYNVVSMKRQIGRYLDIDGGSTRVLNNAEWLSGLNYIDFLRNIGRHFSVNRMIAAEAYKQRMERGLSFIEFNYQILQAYDFLTLFKNEGCMLQMGGNDQWGNILAGEDLIRRVEGKEAHAFTYPLLTNSDGKKMGKTENGAVWIDADKLSPYEYFQYWRNTEDASVVKLLKLFTFLPMEQIAEMSGWKDSKLNEAKEILAFEATKITHGADEAAKALEAARSMFSGGGQTDAIPACEVTPSSLAENGELSALMAFCGICASKGEAKRLIKQGGVAVNGVRTDDFNRMMTADDFDANGEFVLKVGKKKFFRIIMKG